MTGTQLLFPLTTRTLGITERCTVSQRRRCLLHQPRSNVQRNNRRAIAHCGLAIGVTLDFYRPAKAVILNRSLCVLFVAMTAHQKVLSFILTGDFPKLRFKNLSANLVANLQQRLLIFFKS